MRTLYNDIIDNIIGLRILLASFILFFIFSELKNLSDAGRILTMILFVMGIGVISYIASQTTQLIFESELFRMRAMNKRLKNMSQHYIVCGYGRIGHRISEVLKDANIPIVVIENKSTSSIDRLKDANLLLNMNFKLT